MTEVSTIGLDLAKNVFQAHGADAAGAPVFRKKLRRDQVLTFFAGQPPCLVAMEACPGAHHWGREIGKVGRLSRLAALLPSVPEIQALLVRLVFRPPARTAFILAWSRWRRRHQASAAAAHYKHQLYAQL